MEISFIIVMWVVISIIQAISERRKPIPPPSDVTFEIPTLANDPTKPAEVHEINLAEIYRQRKTQAKLESAEVQTQTPVEEKSPAIEITPASAMNAIIMAEILDKPKALRRR